ncbi:hypothetical protein ACHAWF_010520 [Thalassiosira exigua]
MKNLFKSAGDGNEHSWGHANFAKRSDIMSALDYGTLLIEVRIRRSDSTALHLPITSEQSFCRTMLKLFGNEESADVVFEVEEKGQQVHRSQKITQFHAHRFILKQCAPDLDALCGSSNSMVSVPIDDVKPGIFRNMLYYVYGGKVANEDLKSRAKEIIDAADKYGIVGLKLEAEACYVKSTQISLDNAIELLQYADSKNCALMKEAAVDFILENRVEVLEKVSLKDVPEGLFPDILAATARRDPVEGSGEKLSTMRICELRKRLHEKGLDFDGSRESLVARLKENA